jgi:RNA polymerase sigma-70 factor (ECF subfamily)
VAQALRARLLVGDGERAPRISDYSGKSSLRAWLRVVATRDALQILRKHKREVPADEGEILRLSADEDPELRRLQELYRGDVEEAFRAGMRALAPRERDLLRQSFLEGLNVDEVGARYRVHRATAARWIAAARERLFDETRRALALRLGVGRDELESIVRLVQSQLDISIAKHLGGPDRD